MIDESVGSPRGHARAGSAERGQSVHLLVALLLILCAAFLRFSWSDWDSGHHLHPDERFLSIVASSISMPERLGDYFDAGTSTLNPRNIGQSFYVYGDLPLTLTRLVAESLDGLCSLAGELLCRYTGGDTRRWTSYRDIVYVGRWLSALMDMGTLLWLYLLARLLYGRTTAAVALGLGAFCVLQIQLAHFFIVDSFSTQFSTAGLFFLCRAARQGRLRDFVWAGLAIGAAMACRINIAILAVLCLPAALSAAAVTGGPRIRDTALRLAVSALSAAVAFRVLMPNAFSGWAQFDPRWIDNLRTVIDLASPMNFYPPGVQWVNRLPWLYPLKDITFWGMGAGLAVSAIAGWVFTGCRTYSAIRSRSVKGLPDGSLFAILFSPVVVLWLWTGAWFVWVGGWTNPTMRYFLPIYPALTVFAAIFLLRLWHLRPERALARAARATVVLVIATTVVWAVAFTAVYRDGHPRVSASEWIGKQLPADALIGAEYWDDALPLGPAPSHRILSFNHYEDDTPDKRERLIQWLDQVDHIVLSSNRLYASIPRLPLRFPLASEYYRLLFKGELGFSLLAEFHTYPRLGRWEFPDQEGPAVPGAPTDPPGMATGGMQIRFPPADEAFSVYDHPRVLVFEKDDRFDIGKVKVLLAAIDLDTGLRGMPPAVEARAPTGLMLDATQSAAHRLDGTWSRLFDRDALVNRYPVLAAVSLYALISVMGWLMWPLAFWLLSGLEDRGLMLSRTLSLLLGAAGAWFLAGSGFMSFDRIQITAWLIVIICISLAAALRYRSALQDFLRSNGRLALHSEGLFLAVFAFALAIRWQNPDLWHPWFGGEKPMDFAFFNAVLKSKHFPPYDPWFSGGYINYFYFGFVLAALPVKLLGIIPDVAYHLACAAVYALAACGVYGVVFTLACRTTRPRTAALLAVLLVLMIGNLGEIKLASERILASDGVAATHGGGTPAVIGESMSRLLKGEVDFQYPGHHWFWNASRSIPATPGEAGPITEFPFFSLLYGDLHAHFMALPLTLLVLGVALSWWRRPPLYGYRGIRDWRYLLAPAVGGVILGAVRMTNAWDFPTYLGLALVAFWAGVLAGERKNRAVQLLSGLGVFLVSLNMFTLPFESAFATGYTRLIPWHGSRTTLASYLIVHGIFLFPILSYLWLHRGKYLPRWIAGWTARPSAYFALWFIVGVVFVAASSVALNTVPVLLVAVPVGVLSGAMMSSGAASKEDRAWALLVLFAAMLTVVVETVSLAGDVGRMNSVFKAYYQVWVMWGICAAVATAEIWSLRSRRISLWVWRGVSALMITGGLAYTVLATPARNLQRFDPGLAGGLEGARYMKTASHSEHGHTFELQWDHDAIRWLQDYVAGTPVIAEGRSVHEYLWGNRVSVYTGLPTILGWRNHQVQQRSLLPVEVIERRARDVDALYRNPEPQTAERILERYGVEMVYVGPLERAYYPETGLLKFERMVEQGALEIAYRNPEVVIYRVRPSVGVADPPTPLLISAR